MNVPNFCSKCHLPIEKHSATDSAKCALCVCEEEIHEIPKRIFKAISTDE